MTGLTAAVLGNLLAVTWGGADGAEVRARYAIDNAQPTSGIWLFERPAGNGQFWPKTSSRGTTW